MYSKWDSGGLFCTHKHFIEYRAIPEHSARWFTCIECGVSKKGTRKDQKYCGSKCQMNYEYKTGTRVGSDITKNAHQRISEVGFPDKIGKKIPQLHNLEVYKKVSIAKTGVPVLKLRKLITKDKSYWKSADYQAWRKLVMRRDNFTCTKCGDNTGGNLEVHHVLPVSLFREKMLDPINGITMCKDCHKQTSTWGAKAKLLTRLDFGY